MASKLLTLTEWAAQEYETPPCYATLRNWVRDGKIVPRPVKHGKAYRVQPGAKHRDQRKAEAGSLVARFQGIEDGRRAA